MSVPMQDENGPDRQAGEQVRPMPSYSERWAQEDELERQADALLKQVPPDAHCPTYTEAQLTRRGRRCYAMSTDVIADVLASPVPPQAALDELVFLAEVSFLTRPERICLRGWILGWTQREFCTKVNAAAGLRRQQDISRHVRRALSKCYDTLGLSFAQFSKHSLYHRPSHRKDTWRALTCPQCQEEFVWGLGAGRYCSQMCREAALSKRARR